MNDRYATGEVYWRDPNIDPPPKATKLLLLTPGGTAVVGNWAYWCVAWSPLPKIPQALKQRLLLASKGEEHE
jgi:hypothetical protein